MSFSLSCSTPSWQVVLVYGLVCLMQDLAIPPSLARPVHGGAEQAIPPLSHQLLSDDSQEESFITFSYCLFFSSYITWKQVGISPLALVNCKYYFLAWSPPLTAAVYW